MAFFFSRSRTLFFFFLIPCDLFPSRHLPSGREIQIKRWKKEQENKSRWYWKTKRENTFWGLFILFCSVSRYINTNTCRRSWRKEKEKVEKQFYFFRYFSFFRFFFSKTIFRGYLFFSTISLSPFASIVSLGDTFVYPQRHRGLFFFSFIFFFFSSSPIWEFAEFT